MLLSRKFVQLLTQSTQYFPAYWKSILPGSIPEHAKHVLSTMYHRLQFNEYLTDTDSIDLLVCGYAACMILQEQRFKLTKKKLFSHMNADLLKQC